MRKQQPWVWDLVGLFFTPVTLDLLSRWCSLQHPLLSSLLYSSRLMGFNASLVIVYLCLGLEQGGMEKRRDVKCSSGCFQAL